MKIIDEQGRLFGKVNIIDFIIISFLFFLIPTFYIEHKILSRIPEIKREFAIVELN